MGGRYIIVSENLGVLLDATTKGCLWTVHCKATPQTNKDEYNAVTYDEVGVDLMIGRLQSDLTGQLKKQEVPTEKGRCTYGTLVDLLHIPDERGDGFATEDGDKKLPSPQTPDS